MLQLKGWIVPNQKNKVHKLKKKSLYDLKQAPKQWYEKFDKVILKDVFSSISVYNKSTDYEYVIISLYINDMFVFGTSLNTMHNTKCFLSSKFDAKDTCEANIILSMKIITRDNDIMSPH